MYWSLVFVHSYLYPLSIEVLTSIQVCVSHTLTPPDKVDILGLLQEIAVFLVQTSRSPSDLLCQCLAPVDPSSLVVHGHCPATVLLLDLCLDIDIPPVLPWQVCSLLGWTTLMIKCLHWWCLSPAMTCIYWASFSGCDRDLWRLAFYSFTLMCCCFRDLSSFLSWVILIYCPFGLVDAMALVLGLWLMPNPSAMPHCWWSKCISTRLADPLPPFW